MKENSSLGRDPENSAVPTFTEKQNLLGELIQWVKTTYKIFWYLQETFDG